MNSMYKRHDASIYIAGNSITGTLYLGPTGLVTYENSKYMWAFNSGNLHVGSKFKFDNVDKAMMDAKKVGVVTL